MPNPDDQGMRLDVLSSDAQAVRLRAVGRIVQSALGTSPEPMERALGGEGYSRRVLLSLAAATFIDSSGLGWLLSCNRRFREAAGKLVIHSVPPTILDVIKVMRLDQVLDIAEDEASALAMT